jgi:transcriptional regulator of acetoin/glycerol metabolism
MRRDNGSTTLSTGTMDLLMSHGWPGNVRELRGVLCAAKAIAKAEHQRIISPVHVRIRYPGLGANGSATSLSPAVFHPPGMKLRDTLKDCERRALIQALCRAQGDLAGAARLLDVSRTTLWRLIKRHRVERSPATLSSNGETNGTRRFRSETRRFRKETSPLSS